MEQTNCKCDWKPVHIVYTLPYRTLQKCLSEDSGFPFHTICTFSGILKKTFTMTGMVTRHIPMLYNCAQKKGIILYTGTDNLIPAIDQLQHITMTDRINTKRFRMPEQIPELIDIETEKYHEYHA